MGSKSPSDDHPAPLSPSSGKFKLTRTARIKKLILRGHDSAEDRKPDRAAVKMSGERKIRSPGRILLKKQRRMCEKKIESSRIRFSQGILQEIFRDLSRPWQVSALREIETIDPDLSVEIRRTVREITDPGIFQGSLVILICCTVNVRLPDHPALMVSISAVYRKFFCKLRQKLSRNLHIRISFFCNHPVPAG